MSENIQIIKSVNEDLRRATFIAMMPDHTDLHGDFTSSDEVRKAHYSFFKSDQNANLCHISMTDDFEIVESYLMPVDVKLDGYDVKKGTWVVTLQVAEHASDLWSSIKNGEFNGVSIGARAQVDVIDD